MTFKVEFIPEADADLNRLFDFLLERDQTVEVAMRAREAVEAIRAAANSHLSTTPYSYRKVGQHPTLRELIVPFGSAGYVLRFGIRTPEWVLVIGARHQRKEDFHRRPAEILPPAEPAARSKATARCSQPLADCRQP